ncbi:MAG: SPOR domain-containing protein [Bryobacteraceae bacterium]|nr:SPOR domain-containing protein [Bryobacteraceae bacterium]
MARNEDGELELILGNKQLLSVFFIIVFLLGVFFSMGYIVGRNSTSTLVASAGSPEQAAGSGRVPEQTPSPSPRGEAPAVVTRAADPKPELAKPEPAGVEARPEPRREPKAEGPLKPQEPAKGVVYLQLTAIARPDADTYVAALRKKGFAALFAPVPENPSLHRVLVGPLKDAAAVNKARAELEESGFPGGKAIRKQFD